MKKRRQRPDAALRSFRFWLCVWMFVILSITIVIFSSVTVVFEETGIVHGLTDGNWLPFIFSAVASLCIGTLLTPLLLRIPLKPINRLIKGMHRLADGHYEERIDLGTMPMMKNVSESFNAMAAELESTEMLRSDFVNNFSHEFKTPIVSIRGFARILQRGNLSEEKQKQYIDIIVDESTRLSNMATNVLHLTRLENQTILTDATAFNLSEQVRRMILLMEKKWSEKQLSIDASFDEYTVSANRELLDQVWLNLLDNAIKFSPAGGEIAVRVFSGVDEANHSRYVQVSVINHGPEIPPEQQKRIFEKFYQGDTSHASEGAGVGLSVVKRIIALHGGSIDVESSPEETAFHVRLPDGR